MRATIRLTALSLTALFVALGAACSSGPDTADDELQMEQERAEDLLQTPDVLVALRTEPNRLGELTPILERLAQSSGDPDLQVVAEASEDPVEHIAQEYDMANRLPSLDGDRPSYLLLSQLGNRDFFHPALYGLPVASDEWPSLLNFRLLLPTDAPDALGEELVPWLDELKTHDEIGAYRIFEGPRFVRVELATHLPGTLSDAEIDAEAWLESLRPEQLQPPATADYRPTPAFMAFAEGDAPLGVWAPIESFAALGALELMQYFARDYDQVGPAGQPRFFLEGVGRIASAGLINDPVSAENEDVSLLLSIQEQAMVIDLHTTRTARGSRMHAAMDHEITLPEFATDNPFLSLGFQLDMDGIETAAERPFWTHLMEAEGFDTPADPMDGSPLPVDDESGLSILGMALQYPWTGMWIGSDTITNFIPFPRALRLEGTVIDDAPELPVGAVLAGAFADTPEVRNLVQQGFMMAESYVPGMVDAELLERDDEWLEIRVVAGLELADVFGESPASAAVGEPTLSFNMTALDGLEEMVGTPEEATELFDNVHLRSLGEANYHSLRISVGTPDAVSPQPLDVQTEALGTPTSRCRTEIAAAAVEHLSDMRRDPQGRVEAWANAVDERAQQCIEPNHPSYQLIQDRIERARQIAAEIP